MAKKEIIAKNKKPVQRKEKIEPLYTNKEKWLWGIIIFCFSFLIYSNALKNEYAFDDDVICMKNRFVQKGKEGLKDIFTKGFTYGFDGNNTGSYRPLTLASTALEVEFFGNNTMVHHFTNVFLFSLTCLVLFFTLCRIFKQYNILLPLLITLIYASHPIHTEVVANIKSRDEILSFMFFIFSLFAFTLYIPKKNIFYLLLSMLLYFCSLLSKENAFTFWIIYPLIVYTFFKSEKINQILISTIAFLLVFGIYMIIRRSVLDVMTFEGEMQLINNSLMAAKSSTEMFATAMVMMGKYLLLLTYPHPLSCDYSYNQIPIVPIYDIKAIISIVVYGFAFVYAILKIRKGDIIAFGILFFLITMSITSNIFVKIGSSMAERFLYTPSLGFSIIVGFLLTKLYKGKLSEKLSMSKTYFITPLLLIILIAFSLKTYSRNKCWKDNDALFFNDVKVSSNSFRLQSAVGSNIRAKAETEKDPEKQRQMMLEAIQYYNKSLNIYDQQSDTWYNLGVAYYYIKDYGNARISYDNALRLSPRKKEVYNNIGVMFFNTAPQQLNNQLQRQYYDSAKVYFSKAVEIDSNYADAIGNLAVSYQYQGKNEEAIRFYEKALSIEINPNTVKNYSKLLNFLMKYDSTRKYIYEEKLNRINNIKQKFNLPI